MADTAVATSVSNNAESTPAPWGPYWIDTQTAIIVFADSGNDISFARTTNGGANWSVTQIEAGTHTAIAAWFDKETPGNSGTLVHIIWTDAADSEVKYVTVDVSDASVGTIRTIDSGLTIGDTAENKVAITKTVSGNLIVAFMTPGEIETYKSIDSGENWTSRTDFYEGTGFADRDWLLLFPSNTGDDDDVAGVYLDISSSTISIKMYDDSENSITETTVSTGITSDEFAINMDASLRLSDNHILIASHTDDDDAGDDLLTWDITPDSISSPTVTAKTNIFTNQGESGKAAIIINQQNDDVYVAYQKGGTFPSLVDLVFHKSDDGMGTWGSEAAYSETTDDNRSLHGGRTITNSGGRIQWSWYNDDLIDIFVNLVNDIEIAAGSQDFTETPSDSISFSDSLTVTGDRTIALDDSITFTDFLGVDKEYTAFLLQENGDFLLQENGDKIALENQDIIFIEELFETLNITDNLVSSASFSRELDDSITLADSILDSQRFNIILDDNVTFTDNLVNFSVFIKVLDDSLSLSDILAADAGFNVILDDSITFTDSLAKNVVFNKTLDDSITFSDALGRDIVFNKTLAENINFSDSLAAVTGFNVALDDNITFSDSLVDFFGVAISLSETMSLSDSLAKQSIFNRTFLDTQNITDSLIDVTEFNFSLDDTINLSDSLANVSSFNKTFSDTQTLSDSLSKTSTFNRTFSDTQNITDSLARTLTLNILLADNITFTDDLVDTLLKMINIVLEVFRLGETSFNNQLVENDKVIKLRKGGDFIIK